ncbi:exopolysaccharide Pel transporter PelG [Cellulosilyticum ruminicola]|uniref:exopolysaccharide Pel transporter PelG n=1 Tax=Cellulosilyticum ruminicola TaxID=425254 RepID=UPI0006D09F4F|nr:exopolysaccharide Pel transporter PelG [Cellulosilyticum ruminicola]
MAGIGFELKKLFEKEGILQNVKAYSFSAIITIGPALIAMGTIFTLQWLLKIKANSLAIRQIVTSAIFYAFVFSQIITSGFTMVITRYIADQIYLREYEKIMPSLYGLLMLCVPITALVTGVFYLKSPLDFWFKALAYTFTIEMTIIWILTVYLSALKNYRKIIGAYIIGFIGTIVTFLGCMVLDMKAFHIGAMLSMNVGFLMLILCLYKEILVFIGHQKEGERLFAFFSYLEQYPGLFICSIAYTLGLYCHNFIYWQSSHGIVIANTYRVAPTYDTPAFFAFLAMMPTMVYFVVRTETSFYEHYNHYYSLIRQGGTYQEIKTARDTMISTLWKELRNIGEMQLVGLISFALIGYMILFGFGASQILLHTYLILLMGTFSCSIMYVISLLCLYYDNRKDAALITVSFFVGVSIFTSLSVHAKYLYHGFGFFIGATVALYIAYFRMGRYMKNLDYHTFCARPIIQQERRGILTWLSEKLV